MREDCVLILPALYCWLLDVNRTVRWDDGARKYFLEVAASFVVWRAREVRTPEVMLDCVCSPRR